MKGQAKMREREREREGEVFSLLFYQSLLNIHTREKRVCWICYQRERERKR